MGWGKKDTSRETGDSPKEVSRAWHAARDDAERDRRDDGPSRTSDWRRGDDEEDD